MKSTTLVSVMGLAAAGMVTAAANSECPGGKEGVPIPSALPNPGTFTSHGCYSSGGNLTKVKITENLSSGACLDACGAKKYYVMGLHGNDCLCGNAYPPSDDAASDSKCNYPCPSYPCEACGGLGGDTYYSIFNTGVNIVVPDYEPEDDASSSSSSSAAASTAVATKTKTETQPAQTSQDAAESTTAAPEDDDNSKGGSTNVGAIAGGVVAGVVVIGGLVSVLFFMMRRKRNAEIEEEHRRNAAVNAFISGSKPPGSSDGISMTDSRLDPVLAHRRMSDGSIADNQDYSRRILRVR